MNKLILAVGIVAVVGVGIGFAAYNKPAPKADVSGIFGQQGPEGKQGPVGPAGRDGKDGKDAPVKLGSVTGPDSNFECETHQGIRTCFYKMKPLQGTTTPCVFKAPTMGTSTLIFANFLLNNSTTTATVVTMAKATTAFSTSTVLASTTVPIGGQVNLNLFASSSTAVDSLGISLLSQDRTFATSSSFVVGVSGNLGTGAAAGLIPGYVPTGICEAEFKINI